MTTPDPVAAGLIDNVTKRGVSSTYLTLLQYDIDPAVDTLATMSEDTTPRVGGPGRVPVSWTDPALQSPPVSLPVTDIQFGPYTADMDVPVTVLALVDAASGSTGTIRKTFDLNAQYQPKNGDFLTLSASDLGLGLQ